MPAMNWVCNCLEGFKPKAPDEFKNGQSTGGCDRIEALNCQNKDDGFVKYAGVKLPDATDSLVNKSVSLEECRGNCLNNCSCVAYASSTGNNCTIWFGNLVNIRKLSDGGEDLYVRVPASESKANHSPTAKIAGDRCICCCGCYWNAVGCLLHSQEENKVQRYYSPHQDIDITRERKNCILKYFDDADQRREVNVEYSNFSLCMDDFCNDAMHDRSILHPLKWWAVHGASSPRLQALTFKLLGQPSSSSCCEMNWNTYKFIHSATRNKITPQRAEDLVYVHTNLRLVSRCSDSYKEDPFHMWDVGGDQFDSLDETNLGRLEFEDLSLDEPTLEAVLFDNVQENVHEDDVVDV